MLNPSSSNQAENNSFKLLFPFLLNNIINQIPSNVVNDISNNSFKEELMIDNALIELINNSQSSFPTELIQNILILFNKKMTIDDYLQLVKQIYNYILILIDNISLKSLLEEIFLAFIMIIEKYFEQSTDLFNNNNQNTNLNKDDEFSYIGNYTKDINKINESLINNNVIKSNDIDIYNDTNNITIDIKYKNEEKNEKKKKIGFIKLYKKKNMKNKNPINKVLYDIQSQCKVKNNEEITKEKFLKYLYSNLNNKFNKNIYTGKSNKFDLNIEESSPNLALSEEQATQENTRINNIENKNEIKPIFISFKQSYDNKNRCCSCKKSFCLKLYCDCLKKSEYCTNCSCITCLNQEKYSQIRETSINHIRNKRKNVFEDNSSKVNIFGCRCNKSNCVKNYCECYINGAKCSSGCKCNNCLNMN
jgi:hypothetical protein